MAMGAPWGLNRSVSLGIISCATRYLPESSEYSLWYQTDAAISPGNSGGPLVNTEGRVVGINTLGADKLGFAIPAPTIKDILPRLREYGKANWAWLGLELQPLNDFDQNIYFDFDSGVIVSDTQQDSPAQKAGFQPYDRIVSVNGQPVTIKNSEDMPELRRKLGMMPFDQEINFDVIRDNENITITVTPQPKGRVEGNELILERWGFTAKTINRFENPYLFFYSPNGIFIYGIDSSGNAALPAEQRGTVGFLVSDQCQTLSAKEKEEFRSFIAGRENLPIRDLPPEAAKRLFNIMQKTEEEIAKNKIEEEYKRLVNDKYYKGNAEWDAVSGFLSDAQTRANNVAEDIKDTGLPPILICRIGNPKHDFSAIKKEMERTERRDRNHDDDYDRRRDNRDRDDRNDDRRDRDDRRNRSNGGNNYPNGGRRQGYDR